MADDKIQISKRFFKATEWAAQRHRERGRPWETPSLGQVLGIASLVIEDGGSEREAIAAMILDALGGEEAPTEELRDRFGKKVARSLGYEGWDPVLLYQGDANLEIGTVHLKELLEAQGNVVEVLAAYNAGGHRVVRWKTRLGAEDPELLAERIPFVETRDYVRIIQRNRALYRALYAWPEAS